MSGGGGRIRRGASAGSTRAVGIVSFGFVSGVAYVVRTGGVTSGGRIHAVMRAKRAIRECVVRFRGIRRTVMSGGGGRNLAHLAGRDGDERTREGGEYGMTRSCSEDLRSSLRIASARRESHAAALVGASGWFFRST